MQAVLCQYSQLSVASSTSSTVFHGPVRDRPGRTARTGRVHVPIPLWTNPRCEWSSQ